jgi:hypothetical protein
MTNSKCFERKKERYRKQTVLPKSTISHFHFFLPLALLVDFSTLSLWHETREKQNIRAIQNSDGIGTKTHFSQTSKKESDNTHIKNGH